MTASGGGEWRLRGRGIEQKGKRTHGHGHQGGECWGKGRTRGLNNGKKIMKIIFKKRMLQELMACEIEVTAANRTPRLFPASCSRCYT